MGGKDMRITDRDIEILKQHFSENDELLKTLRKVFLPEITADTPIGQIVDLWLTLPLDSYKSTEDAVINMKARNLTITHLEQCLVRLQSIAGSKSETVEQAKKRMAQNSAK